MLLRLHIPCEQLLVTQSCIEIYLPCDLALDRPNRQRLVFTVKSLVTADVRRSFSVSSIISLSNWTRALHPRSRAANVAPVEALTIIDIPLGCALQEDVRKNP